MKRIVVPPPPRPAEGLLLQDPPQPSLFPAIFPDGQPARVAYDGIVVAPAPPMDIWAVDATFRTAALAPEPAAALYALLHRLGGPRGVVRQCEFPVGTENERAVLSRCLPVRQEFPEPTAWIPGGGKEALRVLADLGLKEAGFPAPCSDRVLYLERKLTRKEASRLHLEVVDHLLEAGIIPRLHLEDATRADLHGFLVPFARILMERSRQAEIPVKLRLCDSLGLGVPYEGAAPPRSVQRLVHALAVDAEVPSEWLEWESAASCPRAVPNAVAAWMSGVSACAGSLTGLGGAAVLESLLAELAGLKGELNGLRLEAAAEAASLLKTVVAPAAVAR